MDQQVNHPGSAPAWLGVVAVASAVLMFAQSPDKPDHDRVGPGPVAAPTERHPTAQWLVSLAQAARCPATTKRYGHIWHEITPTVIHNSTSCPTATPGYGTEWAGGSSPDLPHGLINLPPPATHL